MRKKVKEWTPAGIVRASARHGSVGLATEIPGRAPGELSIDMTIEHMYNVGISDVENPERAPMRLINPIAHHLRELYNVSADHFGRESG